MPITEPKKMHEKTTRGTVYSASLVSEVPRGIVPTEYEHITYEFNEWTEDGSRRFQLVVSRNVLPRPLSPEQREVNYGLPEREILRASGYNKEIRINLNSNSNWHNGFSNDDLIKYVQSIPQEVQSKVTEMTSKNLTEEIMTELSKHIA